MLDIGKVFCRDLNITMGDTYESSKLRSLKYNLFNYYYVCIERRTMLDERYLSVQDLQERLEEIENKIKSIE